MTIRILENIGLTKEEISVYLCLLELGGSTAGHIVDKANVPSSEVYSTLNKLINKGLAISFKKGEIQYFRAASPEKLLDYVKKKGNYTKLQLNEVQTLIAELISKQKKAKISEGVDKKESWETGPIGG